VPDLCGAPFACLGQWKIRYSGVLPGAAPLRFAVPNEEKPSVAWLACADFHIVHCAGFPILGVC
jgi:hypothetical protein